MNTFCDLKIGVIQASSQISKNSIIYDSVNEYAEGHIVFNFGCTDIDDERFSYIEITILVNLSLKSGSSTMGLFIGEKNDACLKTEQTEK